MRYDTYAILLAVPLVLASSSTNAQCMPFSFLDLSSLVPPDGQRLGTSVDVAGQTAVIGSVNGVHLITRSLGGELLVSPVLNASGTQEGDLFGVSVALSQEALVVGASLDDTFATNGGAVYVMDLSTNAPFQFQRLAPQYPNAGDWFGRTVAIASGEIAIGSPASDGGGASAGSVTMARRRSGLWNTYTTLVSPSPNDFDAFGMSLAMGPEWLAVGAPGDDHASVNAGAVYMFRRMNSGWALSERLTAEDASVFDSFGQSVDLDGDRLVVGAWGDDDGAANAGAVYVFRLIGNAWVEEQKLVALGAGAADMLGASVAIDGATIIGGAVLADGAQPDSGSAVVYQLTSGTWTQTATILGQTADAYTGNAVSIGDGFLLIGAPFSDATGIDSGSVLALDLYSPACPADLDLNCSVDVEDAVQFLAEMRSMQHTADWAPPFGILDFSDVLAYITDFQLGCP